MRNIVYAQNSRSRAQPCDRVLRDAEGMFSFEMRGLAFEGATLSFCIKPADGLELSKIMQWLMNPVH